MQLQVPVSVGEVLDKITILQIKLAHISDSAKRANVQNELDALLPLVAGDAFTTNQMRGLVAELKAVNEALWDSVKVSATHKVQDVDVIVGENAHDLARHDYSQEQRERKRDRENEGSEQGTATPQMN